MSAQPGLHGGNDLRVGRKMATFQLFFQSGRAKDLSAHLYTLIFPFLHNEQKDTSSCRKMVQAFPRFNLLLTFPSIQLTSVHINAKYLRFDTFSKDLLAISRLFFSRILLRDMKVYSILSHKGMHARTQTNAMGINDLKIKMRSCNHNGAPWHKCTGL